MLLVLIMKEKELLLPRLQKDTTSTAMHSIFLEITLPMFLHTTEIIILRVI